MLDTRQYQNDQPCGDGDPADCDERYDPDQTMLGVSRSGGCCTASRARRRWQVIGNQAPKGQTDIDPTRKTTRVYLDPWDGCVAEHNEVPAQAQAGGVRNLVVITGDRHEHYAVDLKRNYDNPKSASVGTEFVGTSITSGGGGGDNPGNMLRAANPHLRFDNAQRGYVRVKVEQFRCQSDFRVLPY